MLKSARESVKVKEEEQAETHDRRERKPEDSDKEQGKRREEKMAVTIKDVARAANTSITTVSRVINNQSYSISEETVNRVRQAIRELNYHPNARARDFARQSTRRILLLYDLHPNAAFESPHMFEILSGAENILTRKGYGLEIRSTDTTSVSALAEELISAQSVDGLLIHASVVSRPLSALLTKTRFPHVVLGKPDFESQMCWIDINNVLSGDIAANHLLDEGYRRIAYIGGRESDRISSHRLEGVRQALAAASCRVEEQFIWLGESTPQEGIRMTEGLLSQKERPDAIICANNNLAFGCVEAIRRMGLRIPKDVAVMTFDNYPYAGITQPPLTVVDIDVYDMGVQAGMVLLGMIGRPNQQVQTYTTTSNLIVRESTRRKKRRG